MRTLSFQYQVLIEDRWKETADISLTDGEAVMFIKIENRVGITDIAKHVAEILGYATTDHLLKRLKRKIPARHPRLPWLFASDVYVEGIGQIHENTVQVLTFASLWGDMDEWILRIKFCSRKYQVLDDDSIARGSIGPGIRLPTETQYQKEYMRWTEWLPLKPAVETIARPGITWTFINADARRVSATFGGDQLIRAPKGLLKVIWHDVPLGFLLYKNILPVNIAEGLNKVNSRDFPYNAPFDYEAGQQDVVISINGVTEPYEPGTLLFIAADIDMDNQTTGLLSAAQQLQQGARNQYFSKKCNVIFTFSYFNPSCDRSFDSRLMIQVQDGLTPNSINVEVVGHNLFPLPRPSSRGFSWYPASKSSGQTAVFVPPPNFVGPIPSPRPIGTVANGDKDLLYQYYNFERLFTYPGLFTQT